MCKFPNKLSDNSIGTPSGLRPSVVHSLACRLARLARLSARAIDTSVRVNTLLTFVHNLSYIC
nr:MAG TPA: hypothetical protein [Caudoviricetes sp.]